MTWTRLDFPFTFSPILRTRESLSVAFHISVEGGSAYRSSLFIPFTNDFNRYEEIRLDVERGAYSLVSQWALQFNRADEALTPAAYESLRQTLSGLKSQLYKLDEVTIKQILPLSPPRPEPPPPKKSRLDATLEELSEDIRDYDALRAFEEFAVERYPDLFADTKHGGRARDKLRDKMYRLLLNRRGQ